MLVPKGEPNNLISVQLPSEVYTALMGVIRINMPAETVGVLLGHRTVSPGGPEPHEQIAITDVIPLLLVPGAAGLAPERTAWRDLQARLNASARTRTDGPELSIAGWFYADPGIGIFQRRYDLSEVHRALSAGSNLLLFVNPSANRGAFYSWRDDALVPVGGFHEVTPNKHAAAIIPWAEELQGMNAWLGPHAPRAVQSATEQSLEEPLAEPEPDPQALRGRRGSSYVTSPLPVITDAPDGPAGAEAAGPDHISGGSVEAEPPVAVNPSQSETARVQPYMGAVDYTVPTEKARTLSPGEQPTQDMYFAGPGITALPSEPLLSTTDYLPTPTASSTGRRASALALALLLVLLLSLLVAFAVFASGRGNGTSSRPLAQSLPLTGTVPSVAGMLSTPTAPSFSATATGTPTTRPTPSSTPTFTVTAVADVPVPPVLPAPQGAVPTPAPTTIPEPTPTTASSEPPPVIARPTNTQVRAVAPPRTATRTNTPRRMTPTRTPVRRTATRVPPTSTQAPPPAPASNTPVPASTGAVPPTATSVRVPPTNTPVRPATNTPAPPPPTNTPVPPATNTPEPPPPTSPPEPPPPTNTPVPPPTNTPVPPTDTPVPPPTNTPPVVDTPRPTNTRAPVDTPRPTP